MDISKVKLTCGLSTIDYTYNAIATKYKDNKKDKRIKK